MTDLLRYRAERDLIKIRQRIAELEQEKAARQASGDPGLTLGEALAATMHARPRRRRLRSIQGEVES